MIFAVPVIALMAFFDGNAVTAAIFRWLFYLSGAAILIYVITTDKSLRQGRSWLSFEIFLLITVIALTSFVLIFEPRNIFYYVISIVNTVAFSINAFILIYFGKLTLLEWLYCWSGFIDLSTMYFDPESIILSISFFSYRLYISSSVIL